MEARTVYDLILAAIIVLIAIRGWRQGLLSEILRLAGWVAAAVLVTRYAGTWAQSIYHTVLEPRTVAKVAAAIPEGAMGAMNGVAAAMQTIQNVINSLGGFLGGQLITPETATAILNMAGQDTASLARAIASTVLQPVMVSGDTGGLPDGGTVPGPSGGLRPAEKGLHPLHDQPAFGPGLRLWRGAGDRLGIRVRFEFAGAVREYALAQPGAFAQHLSCETVFVRDER